MLPVSQIISHTPTWVFVVFFALLTLGFMQSKQRKVRVKTIFILPLAMVLFSLFGVYSVFGLSLVTLALWVLGLVLALMLGLKLAYPKVVSYSLKNNKLTIPGSWTPLALMMAIFFTKYFMGFAVARSLPIINDMVFIALICMLYGVFSGTFLARCLVMFKASKSSE
ncbi:hypothetical protein AX660_21300 [Paraglaciecola hydrolytica]|uniref:DUF1453 domain-containing protein n=1 Tax=Paraglaciecola hydrolytica TaxID=1799789 RepID=A0A148KLV9_9ALTE|nr:hypothetical protein AX660_21300 [Paraglaciecola hydrolytica]